MAERFEEGTEAPPGVYRCTVCGAQVELRVGRVLTPCANCVNAYWEPVEEEGEEEEQD
jgi:hypothetical protein